jgi:UDP:flavonoid glycosyltransferase YjiC (YdhE family)
VSTYLMALWAGGGNAPPQLVIAKRLLRAGHVVHILAPSVLRNAVTATGATFEPYRQAPEHDLGNPQLDLIKDWEANGLAAAARVRNRLMVGTAAAFAADLLDLVTERRPDALLIDYALFGGFLAGERASLPTIGLVHSIYPFPAPGIPPFGLGLRPARGPLGALRDRFLTPFVIRFYNSGLPELNAVRGQLGLRPLSSTLDLFSGATRLLVMTSSGFDFPGKVPSNARYVGVQVDPDTPPVRRARSAPGTPPVVLVGFSTTYQKQQSILRRVIDALGALDVIAKVSLGPVAPDTIGSVPSNVQLFEWVDHNALLPEVDLVVTHGGHGTVTTALRYGVPVVCLPMGRDQKDVAIRAVIRRAGVLASASLPARSLSRVIEQALGDQELRGGAQRLADRFAADDPASAISEVEAAVAQPHGVTAGTRSVNDAPHAWQIPPVGRSDSAKELDG